MKTLLYYLLQMIVASGILYAYYHFALRNKRFHHYNRFYLLAATLISITIPFLNIPVYFTTEETNSSFVLQTLTAISPGSPQEPVLTATADQLSTTGFFTTKNILYLLYALTGAIVLLRIIISLISIRRIARNNPSEKIDNIRFIKTSEPSTPFSFFRWLFWNRKIELHSEKGEQIFKHELFHIQQKHSWDIMYLEILSVLFWINPFFYLIKKEIKAIHEFLADRFAINENKKWEYAELLLMQVLNTGHHLVNPFFHNQIKRRIAMITTSNKPRHQYLRKLMVLPLAAIIILLFAFSYKNKKETGIQKNSKDTSGIQNNFVLNGTVSMSQGPGTTAGPTKITINGKELKAKELRIDGMDTVKIDSVSFYIKGPDGKEMDNPLMILTGKGTDNPMIVLDGMIQENFDLDKLNFGTIESLIILKGDNAILKYGAAAKNGAIEILTGGTILPSKKYPDTLLWVKDIFTDTTKPVINDVKVKSKVEIDPKFPGGLAKWKQYLSMNLNALLPVEKGAPEGDYTVVVQFIVSKEGTVSDVKALTKHGYGMEEEAMRVIKTGPYWVPAIDMGKQVVAYRKQPITFQIWDGINDKKKSPVSIELETPDPDILFIGIDNYISVAVTGVAVKDQRVSISEGTLTGTNGNYYAKISTVSDNIILTVADKNGKIHGTKKFKARLRSDTK